MNIRDLPLRRTLGVALATGAVLLAGACEDDDPLGPDMETFTAVLTPLNGSGVFGTATFEVTEGGAFVASVEATGLDGTLHPQHIHFDGECPTVVDDTNGDGFVDVVEGVPAYGPILVPLDGDLATQAAGQPDGFPSGSTIDYSESVDLSTMLADLRASDPDPDDPVAKLGAGADLDLDTRTVVLHGVADDTSLPETVQTFGDTPATVTLPVACGAILVN